MAKQWKKVQRADSPFTGNVTGSVNGTAVANVYSTANKPTKSDVGLGNVVNEDPATLKATMSLDNVTNESKATMFANPTFTGTATGLSKASVGLGNVDNSLFTSTGKFKGAITKSDGTTIFDPSDGNFTGKIAGSTASDVKSKAEDAKSAVDGNASITMVGGSLSIGTESGGVYPFSVDSSGNLKILDDEFQALADGTVNCKGSFTINQDSSSNSRITLAGSGSGTAEVEVQGANPTFDLGGSSPLGTSTLHLKRGATSNQARIQFRTGSSGSEFTIGNSNNSGLQTQYAIHHGPLWSSGTADERALSFDADGKMGMYANSKSVAGFTFGSDGTNKHVYIKDGGLSVGTSTVTDGDIRCTDIFTSGNIEVGDNLNVDGGDGTFYNDLSVQGTTNLSTTNVDGTLDASGYQALTGWHTKDYIYIPPDAWTINEDTSYYNYVVVDNGAYGRVLTSSSEVYANVIIPSGYKTHSFRINGNSSHSVSVGYSACDTSTYTGTQMGALYTNTTYTYGTYPITSQVSASDSTGRYIVLKWAPSSTSHYLYGAWLKIVKA